MAVVRSTELQRKLDFWFGIPLVWLVGIFRRPRRSLPSSPRKIAILQPSAIGDLILASGIFIHLKNSFPSGEIHVFHGTSNAAAVPLLPVDVVSHECNFSDIRHTAADIRNGQFDLVIDLTPWPRLTALYAAISQASTVGFYSEKQHRHYAFDVLVPHLRTCHEIENFSAVAQLFPPVRPYVLGIRRRHHPPDFPVDSRRVILCHVAPGGSRAHAKRWPTLHWVTLSRFLVDKGFSIGFTGLEKDKSVVSEIIRVLGLPHESVFSLCGTLSLAELVEALGACRLCITVDTAIVHLASALDIPTVALFGATHSSRWGARSHLAINLDAPHENAGFINLGFEGNAREMEVMSSLSPKNVSDAVDALLAQTEKCRK